MSSTLDSYTSAMDDLCFSDDAKARMAANIAAATAAAGAATAPEAVNNAEVIAFPARRKKARPWAKAAAAVAVALALAIAGTTAAVAAGVLPKPSTLLSSVFGGSAAQTQIIDEVGRPIGASCTDNGVTVTAESIIGDRTSYAIVFSITRDDGETFSVDEAGNTGKLALMTEDSRLFVGGLLDGLRSGHGGSYFYDDDPSDSTIYFVQQMSIETADGSSIVGKTAHFHLGKVLAFDDDFNFTELISGDWNLNFEIDYVDTTVELPGVEGTKVAWDTMEATLQGATVSAIGITVDYVSDGEWVMTTEESGQMNAEDQARQNAYFGLPIVVTFSDGSQTTFPNGLGGSTTAQDGKEYVSISEQFDEVIDVDAVESVTIGDATFSIR